jgi:hypothetical protein
MAMSFKRCPGSVQSKNRGHLTRSREEREENHWKEKPRGKDQTVYAFLFLISGLLRGLRGFA